MDTTTNVVTLPRRRWGTVAKTAAAAAERFKTRGYDDRAIELTELSEKIDKARATSDVSIPFTDTESLALDELMVLAGIDTANSDNASE